MLAAYRSVPRREFCCPGHRRGEQTDPETRRTLGDGAWLCDVTQVAEIDDLLAPSGAIAEAQSLAADFWHARQTWFLVNGTSSGIHAAMLALCGEGDVVALPRAAHRSAVEALILCGARPRWIRCEVDELFGRALPPSPQAFLEASEGARMTLAVRPTYHGDVVGLEWSDRLASCGTILLVDEAWGAHLPAHPELPAPAGRSGADLVVNSTHKTGGALSGGSMLHRCSERVDGERVSAAVRLLTTTSPYYAVLASLDGARRDLALRGRDRMAAVIDATRPARVALRDVPGLDVTDGPGCDPTRLVFSAARRGWSGAALARALHRDGIEVELADSRAVVALVCGKEDARNLPGLVDAVVRALSGPPPNDVGAVPPVVDPVVALSPREAFAAAHRRLPLRRAKGRVAAEMVCPYPPGMPIVSYGERVTEEVVEVLERIRVEGGRLQGCADPTLATVGVVK
jgi:arginine decarboxylase